MNLFYGVHRKRFNHTCQQKPSVSGDPVPLKLKEDLPESLLELPDPGGECLLVGVVLLLALSLNISQTRIYTEKTVSNPVPSRDVMSLNKLSLAGNYLTIPGQGEFGDGKIGKNFLYCVQYTLRADIFFDNIVVVSFYCMYILFQTDAC